MGDGADGGFGLNEILPEAGRGTMQGMVEGALLHTRGCDGGLTPSTACGGPAVAQGPRLRLPRTGEEADLILPPLVPTRPRDDGWTPARQRGFLEALANCGSVSAAARSVGMSRESAYALRRRADARGFAQAWDAARVLASEHLVDLAWDRATVGEVRQIFYHGELVGETRHYDNRLLLGLIAQNRALLAEQGLIDPPQVTAAVAADWEAALDRAERGEVLAEGGLRAAAGAPAQAAPIAGEAPPPPDGEDIPPPLEPETDRYGAVLGEGQQLDVGLYQHWWDDALECWLTNWPAPEGWSGREFRIDAEGVATPLSADDEADFGEDFGEDFGADFGAEFEEDQGEGDAGWRAQCRARTLTPEEQVAADEEPVRAALVRARRLELYRRAAFGLASAAERASIAAANGGEAGPVGAGQWAGISSA